MKIVTFPVFGILLFTGSSVASARPKTLSPVKVPDSQMEKAPYRFNGVVSTDLGHGSGFSAWKRKTFFSAAHVVFDPKSGEWGAPPTWTAVSNAETLDESKSILSRGYYRWTNYAEIVAEDGSNGDAFGRDVILGFAFENLIAGRPATLNLRGKSDLKANIRTMITGYPAENAYTGESISGYFLHRSGPGITPYKSFYGSALQTTLITTGPGNSGGPVWTDSGDTGWTAAGVLVGGLPSETVVYAFSGDINALTRSVEPVIGAGLPQSKTAGDVSASSHFYANAHSKVIPDGVHKWTEFPISVGDFEDEDEVKKVLLSCRIRTTHRGDLQVVLSGPGGFQVLVHNEEGMGADNLILKDKDVSETFTDIPANGKWTLLVQDRLEGDIAIVDNFRLEIACEGGTTVPTP